MRRRPLRTLGLTVVLCTALALAACSRPDPHAFDDVDAAARSIGVESLATLDYQGRSGSGGFSDDRPTLVYVLSGDGVKQQVDQALTDAGFTSGITDQPAGKPESWTHGEDITLVSVVVLPAGATYQDAEQEEQTVERDSVLVELSG
jgi:hypothetical protein